ncbi:MAG: metal dependent phosphohydrolase [uncultured bacterium (gcode 4)]|uniref:Metal dependent phosphohydrolase n=1 Tax=uncultured bacterium (gcode 4) TaxID=1234023 RepID=K2G338_9BACT|nr:MAG: metal dependent phosphohydrolase [uncultured bacterium (gcode 4)]
MRINTTTYNADDVSFIGPLLTSKIEIDHRLKLVLSWIQDRFSLSDEEVLALSKLTRRFLEKEKKQGHFWTITTLSSIHYILWKIIDSDYWRKEFNSEEIDDEEVIQWLWLDDLKNNKNPIVIYHWDRPLYWNLAMQNITGYDFTEIKERHARWESIMHLLYGWSPEEIHKVQSALWTWRTYENAVFTLKSKNDEKHMIAWFTRFIEYKWKVYTIRGWSEETSQIIKYLDQSNIAVQDFFNDIMDDKDPYTKWHINRVRTICDMIWRNMWFSEYALKQLWNMAFFHDLWKRYIADDILKKTWTYTLEEKEIMESHTWVWIMEVLNSWYETYADWMVHHCDFYNKSWKPELRFDEMVSICKNWWTVDLADFNKLMWTNIPEVWRMISIADTIDAIGSRRIYSKRAGHPIGDIIKFITKELLDSSGLIEVEWKIQLNKEIWHEIEESSQKNLPYCIKFGWSYYIPNHDARIQFDPHILIKNYEKGDLSDQIKHVILENDKEIVKEKIVEFVENIQRLEDKKDNFSKLMGNWAESIDSTLIFGAEDEKELERLRNIYDNLIHIKEGYQKEVLLNNPL